VKTNIKRGIRWRKVALAVAVALSPALAGAQTAVLGNFQQIYVYPQISFNPGACPATVPVNTVTGGAGNSHGVGFYGTDFALVSYFGASQIRNVQLSTATVLNTISTTGVGYNGTGTIAIAPSLSYAIAAAGNTAFIFQAPFTAPTATTVTLPGSVAGYQTEAIVFNSASRAFIAHSGGISVLDPPYTSVAFTIPGDFESVALTPNGNTLLATNLNAQLGIINGPFSAASTTSFLTIAGTALDGITVTPDGSRALVISASGTSPLFSIAAPFTTTSTVDVIPFPAGLGSFEDISVSSDGLYALATGNNGTNLGLIRAPFTTAGATSCQIPVTGGRGAGAVRFLPPGLQPPPPPPPRANVIVPASSPEGLAFMALLMAVLGFFGLRKFRR
jgi:hypothetical protein